MDGEVVLLAKGLLRGRRVVRHRLPYHPPVGTEGRGDDREAVEQETTGKGGGGDAV